MSQLAPQRDARVTEEIRNPMGWVFGRTARLGVMSGRAEIQEIIQNVVTHLDNFCVIEELDPKELEGRVVPTRALKYITIKLGGRPCWACEGRGVTRGTTPCPTCEGSGIR